MGFDVVVSDVDTVWLQNPLPYLANYPDADILVSSDSLVSSASAQFAALQAVCPAVSQSMSLAVLAQEAEQDRARHNNDLRFKHCCVW